VDAANMLRRLFDRAAQFDRRLDTRRLQVQPVEGGVAGVEAKIAACQRPHKRSGDR
jgi:hypothetical protein